MFSSSAYKTILSLFLGFFFFSVASFYFLVEYFRDLPELYVGELARGEVEIVVPEGFTARQVEERLIANGFTNIFEGSLVGLGVEGYLFPDTYRMFNYFSPEDVAGKMMNRFAEKVGEAKSEDIILASIVQKEIYGFTNMRKVAGIFKKRLKAGMRLQADSTVNFLTGKSDSRASLSDTKIDSLYNTYASNGLPPGPISNPGLDAIKATQSPIETPYWFFLTTPQGKIVYSRNFDEHKRNKAKYY